jgi:hypothetical protein
VLGTIHYIFFFFIFFFYFFHFFIFSNNNSHQNILTFFTFYITQIIFYYYLNKKFTKIQIFFTFLYKFFLFYITSSFLINFKINNPTTLLLCTCLCQTTLSLPNVEKTIGAVLGTADTSLINAHSFVCTDMRAPCCDSIFQFFFKCFHFYIFVGPQL